MTRKRRKQPSPKNFREWLIRILTALISLFLAGISTWSYANTGTLIPRRELLTGTASFHFIDVGQGDATLVLTADSAILIDAGTPGFAEPLVQYIKTYAGKLDYLILTHPHDDHVGGADEVLADIPVSHVLMPVVEDNKYSDSLLATAAEQHIPVTDARPGLQLVTGDITCTVLGPVHTDYENLNNASIVLRVDIGGTSALFSGDAESEAENDVLTANHPSLFDCDIYHVGHHGSSTSTSLPFLTAISPDHCVISCGKDNAYGHPHTTVTELLAFSTAEVYRTDESGTIILDTDGTTISRRFGESWE